MCNVYALILIGITPLSGAL